MDVIKLKKLNAEKLTKINLEAIYELMRMELDAAIDKGLLCDETLTLSLMEGKAEEGGIKVTLCWSV